MFRPVSLSVAPDGSVVDRKKPGRPRARFPANERRETPLVIAYSEIAEAQPLRLREIIERAETVRVTGRALANPSLQRAALAIIERAERRLNWFRRQEA
jgi:hypothetical protein